TDDPAKGLYREFSLMAAHYRRHWAVIGYQPTLYVHPAQPPRHAKAPCPCGVGGMVPATDYRREHQAGADVPAGQIKAGVAALRGIGVAECRPATVPRRWIL